MAGSSGFGGQENMKVLGDLGKHLEKFDRLADKIEESFKNIEKSARGTKENVKAMDGSFGGSTGGGTGNGSGGSVMNQPPLPGSGGGRGGGKGGGFEKAFSDADKNIPRIEVTSGPTNRKIVGDFIDTVMNGPVGKIIKPAAAMAYNALPSVQEAFTMDTLKNRMRFQGFGTNQDITDLLKGQSGQGTPNDMMDFLAGFRNTRGLGNNFSSIGRNLSIASNLTPGVGYEGAASALGALNAPRNVNFLRMIGIQVRDQISGNMRDLDKIIDDLWNVISRQVRGRNIPITVNDLRLSLQPGNALASLLDQYFGNDPYLRSIVEDGLYAKAQNVSGADLAGLERIGARSQAIASKAAREGASVRFLDTQTGSLMAGFVGANKVSQGLSNLFALPGLRNIGQMMSLGKGFLDTFAEMGNGSGGAMLGQVGQLLAKIPFLAEGGPTAARNAYVVGEKGPELFVPESDGRIIPHHELDLNNLQFQGFRHTGGKVTIAGPDGSHGHPDVASGQFHKHRAKGRQYSKEELIPILMAAGFRNGVKGKGGVTINQIDDALAIISAESGRHADNANLNGSTDMSYGLFQINMKNDGPYPNMGKERLKKFGLQYDWDLYDPLKNAQAAYAISSKGNKWHPAWSTAKGVGLAGPWGNPHGNQGGGLLSGIEGLFNQALEKTGVVGTVVGGISGAAGNAIGNIGDFIKSRFEAASQATDFMKAIFNLFKDIPGIGGSRQAGQSMNFDKSSANLNPQDYREHGGAVSAMGVNYGGRGSTINYGGVTVKIVANRSWDERRLAQEIRKTLEYDTLMKRAVSA